MLSSPAGQSVGARQIRADPCEVKSRLSLSLSLSLTMEMDVNFRMGTENNPPFDPEIASQSNVKLVDPDSGRKEGIQQK